MNRKTKKEQIFIVSVICLLSFVVISLTSCNGSCMGCSFSCQDEDGEYSLGGLSYASDGCCSSYSCKIAAGELTGGEDDEIQETYYASCSQFGRGCCSSSSNYTGCFIGKGVDCGNYSVTCGSFDDDTKENTFKCVDGCVSCDETYGKKGLLYEIIYEILGI